MSSSGKGQSTLRGPADVRRAWDYAMQGGRVSQSRVIVEGFVDFEYEITLLTVRARDAHGEVQTYFCEPIGHLQVAGDYVESWQPQAMRPAALARAKEIAAAVTGDLGGRGVFGVELFVRGDEVWFSEVSPRPHDTGLVTLCSQRLSEFELHARAILGLPVDTALREPGASAVIYGGVDAQALRFEGVAEALAVPRSDLRLFGKPESFVKRRMGVAVANGADVTEARERAKLAASRVKPVAGLTRLGGRGQAAGARREKRFLPASLAAYLAVSACASSVADSSPSSGKTAAPTLAEMRTVTPSMSNGTARASMILRPTASQSSVCGRLASTAPNSSPPKRDTVSSARTQAVLRCATCTSSRSPAAWPWLSLTALKPSRSM